MDWFRGNAIEIVGVVVALVLGAMPLYVSWRERQRGLRVVIERHAEQDRTPVLYFRVINNGPAPVSILGRGIELPGRRLLGFYPRSLEAGQNTFPMTLDVGQQFSSKEWEPYVCGDLLRWEYKGRIKIRAWFEDGRGKIILSAPYEFSNVKNCTVRDILRWVDAEVERLKEGNPRDQSGPTGGLY